MLGKLRSLWRDSAQAGSDPLALYHAGELQRAERAAQERLAAGKEDSSASLVQAFLLVERGRGKDAIALAEKVLAADVRNAQAWLAIARAHAAAGRRKQQGEALQAAAQRDGRHAAIRAEQALLALAQGQPELAARHLARPGGGGARLALAHRELAGVLLARGQLRAAAHELEQAIAADPADAIAHANLGAVHKDLGRGDDAARSFERALQLQPGFAEAAYNFAMLRIDRKEWSAGAQLLRTYLAQHPRDAQAQYWLGNALMGQGEVEEARPAYEAALRLDRRHLRAQWGLAMAQLPGVAGSTQEQAQGALAFAQALQGLQDGTRDIGKREAVLPVGAQQPFFLAYVEDNHAPVLRRYGALCSELTRAWAKPLELPAPAPRRQGGKLRVGIVSAHVQSHSVWHAILRGWIEHLDRTRFELHLFHTGGAADAETKWAAARVEQLQQGLGDWTAWAKAIADARLDVVVYPEIGMDATSLRLAALRLARVQLAAWGHPLTTGLPTLDGYLSAEAFEPPQAQEHYTEHLHALPRLGCAYRPYATKPQPPDLARWGIASTDRVLVAPGVAFKYGPREDALWVDIARRCAPCKLVFFQGSDQHGARLQRRLRSAFADAGVDFDAHVRFIPWLPQAGFFGLLQRADVFLDTVGFSGFNTAMQAVECGIPLVAWEGRFMRGRFASSILRALQLDEWVAHDHADYAAKVERLCADAALRKAVRAQIAERRDTLYDDQASVDSLAALLERLAAAA